MQRMVNCFSLLLWGLYLGEGSYPLFLVTFD